jgi:hypothetical protein
MLRWKKVKRLIKNPTPNLFNHNNETCYRATLASSTAPGWPP